MTAGGGPVRLRVTGTWLAADQVRCFLLADPDGADLPAWAPGAHVDLRLPAGMTRQYSLCGDPADRRAWRVAVLLEEDSRGGSRYLHERAREGTELAASLPRNNFPLVSAARYVFIAGGIGITPLLPMIAAASASGAEWRLHYGARSLDRMAFTDELDRHGGRCARYPQDSHGLMPLAEILGPAADGAAVYCCGPEPLLTAVEQRHQGRRAGTLHVERFRPVALAPGTTGSEFDVVLGSSGRVIRVRAGQSVLAALDRAGVDVPSSCREGTCATCETAVLDGEVEHRDSVLTDEERAAGQTMMPCVSRARSPRLVLDLLPGVMTTHAADFTVRRCGGVVESERSGHAIVLGAGVAGLLAARVLAEHYQAVTVLERDELNGPAPRRGVPQGRHLHGLMDGGRAIIEELFPGLTTDAVGRGAPTTEVLVGSRWYLSGLRAAPTATGLTTLLASRPLLESMMRDRVTALPGVSVRQGTVAEGLVEGARPGVIAGARVRSGESAPAAVAADLVVDATGRASRAPQWLDRAGLPVPEAERIDVDLGYASRTYQYRPGHLGGDRGVVVSTMPGRRGGGAITVEGSRWHVTLGGMLGDHPPTDHAGFESFAATLPVPDIHELIVAAEPIDDPVPHRFTGSLRRHFERLGTHPEGFLVLGDALCSFNPLYAQGMTVAAQQAMALRACLRAGRNGLPRRFYARSAPLVDVAWQMSTNADLSHPGVHGRRTLRTRLTNAYVRRCHVAAHADPVVARTFMRVANLVDPASVLLRPATVARVLRHGSPR